MRILALETSTSRGSVAVAEDGNILAEERFFSERGHNTAIFDPLEKILATAREAGGITRIVVGTGPGSYSGVRVGIAVANALSLTDRVPVAGISSLIAPANLSAPDYWVTGDARRQTWFLARVEGRRLAGEIELMPLDELRRRIISYRERGEAVVTFDDAPPPEPGAGVEVLLETPRAGVLALRAAGMSEVEFEEWAKMPLQPIYLRAPHITTPRGA